MVSSSSGQTRSSKSTSSDCIKYASSRVRSSGLLSASEEKGSGSLPSVLFHSVLFPRVFTASGCAESTAPEPFFSRFRKRGSAKFLQYDSLTMTETELLRQGIKAKTGRSFTRFSIKSILQNPVYLIADKDAYQYFVDNEAELFAPESDFDGVRGVLAYNRSDQEKGRATVYNPISEWIVSVGEHPGIISSNRWIRVQESLERNKSKSYHKSRGNEALLTGLLWCSCGSRMYPKVTGRKTADRRVVCHYFVLFQKSVVPSSCGHFTKRAAL